MERRSQLRGSGVQRTEVMNGERELEELEVGEGEL